MEALVWNTRLRIYRGVGVAGNGVGLLMATLQSEIPAFGGTGREWIVYRQA
jgi:hypothetical protein